MSCENQSKNSSEDELSGQPKSNSESEVFTRHYAELCVLLPATIEELLPRLVAKNVISFEEEEEISSESTSSLKVRAILKRIRKALFEGIPRPFHELLKIIQASKNVECSALARQICSELNMKTIDPGKHSYVSSSVSPPDKCQHDALALLLSFPFFCYFPSRFVKFFC